MLILPCTRQNCQPNLPYAEGLTHRKMHVNGVLAGIIILRLEIWTAAKNIYRRKKDLLNFIMMFQWSKPWLCYDPFWLQTTSNWSLCFVKFSSSNPPYPSFYLAQHSSNSIFLTLKFVIKQDRPALNRQHPGQMLRIDGPTCSFKYSSTPCLFRNYQ